MNSYEIEVKSLLGDSDAAARVRDSLAKIVPSTKLLSRNTQLNHYFIGGSLQKLSEGMQAHLPPDAAAKLTVMAQNVQRFSVRTRDKDGVVYLVVKAAVDDTTSENGIARIEFEEKVGMLLDDLDTLVLGAGFEYQAKWSREREEYSLKGTNITLDKNAGYGWLAEFERMITDERDVESARAEIDSLMSELGVVELSQDRLARMFDFYNAHWRDYYGTDNVFTIE